MKITWGELEIEMTIAPNFHVTDLTPTHIAVDKDGTSYTYPRKDPWVTVEIVPMGVSDITEALGGSHIISIETVATGEVTYFEWPADEGFKSAAQSHLEMVHSIVADDNLDYSELASLHDELHTLKAEHAHIPREELKK